jgi:hypothetical protein
MIVTINDDVVSNTTVVILSVPTPRLSFFSSPIVGNAALSSSYADPKYF